MSDLRQTGVYRIRHIESGNLYIGSAANSFSKRWQNHRYYLRKGTHHNKHLQLAWNKYGEDAFVFEIVYVCDRLFVLQVEQCFLDYHKSSNEAGLYNTQPVAGSALGMIRSTATRQRMSDAMRGKRRSRAVCEKMSASRKGVKFSEERKAKMRGRSPSPETRAKLSLSGTGRKKSDEFCERMSRLHKGKVVSLATRKKQSNARIGKITSDETRSRQSAALKGRAKTPAHIEAARLGRIRSKYEQAAAMFACGWLT